MIFTLYSIHIVINHNIQIIGDLAADEPLGGNAQTRMISRFAQRSNSKKMVFTRIIITWSFLKVLKKIYKKIRVSLKTADSSIFEPVGQKVKDFIENSDRCKGDSACEVRGFKFLGEDSRESDQPRTLQYLKGFKWIKGRNENQLLECSGFFQFEPRVLTKRNFQKKFSGNTTVQT